MGVEGGSHARPASGSRLIAVRAVRVARIAGIDVRVHPLLVLFVALLAVDSAAAGESVVRSLSWLVVVFSCVLVHELSHSLVARRRSVPVRGIVLLPIGGMSQMERLPDRPRDELAIAIAGPLSSIALAVAAGVVAVGAGQGLLPVDLLDGTFLHRLAWFNLLLGGFNLLPAFPLDGGRVLRATLARRQPLERATAVAAAIGRYLALVMAAVGIAVNLWLLIIAVFVYFGASAEEAATLAHVRLQGHRVGEVMVLDPLCLPAELPVGDALAVLRRTTQEELPVVAPTGAYVGMTGASVLGAASPGSSVRAHMLDAPAPALAPVDDLETSVAALLERGATAAAVVEQGRVVGLLRVEDVDRFLRGPNTEPWHPRQLRPR